VSDLEKSPRWQKSSSSGEGDCLEWSVGPSDVRLRHSGNPTGPEVVLTHSEWLAFISGIKLGEGDLHPNDTS
jgi:hypothetical protein